MNKASKILNIVIIFLIFSSFFISSVFALDSDKESKTSTYRQTLNNIIEEKEELFVNELDAYVRYMPSAGAKSQSGKIGIVDTAQEYSCEAKVFGKLPIELGLGTEYIGINNTTQVELPAHLTSVFFGAETTVPFFKVDKTYFTVGLAAAFPTDNWNFHSSSFRIPQRYFLIYQPNDKLTLIGGVAVIGGVAQINPNYDTVVWPILGLIYKPNDKLTYTLIPKRPEISYVINNNLTVFCEANMTSDEYEVTRGSEKNIILEYNSVNAGLGLKYRPNKYINGSISTGGVFNRSIRYRDDNYGKVAIKDGFYTEFRVVITI